MRFVVEIRSAGTQTIFIVFNQVSSAESVHHIVHLLNRLPELTSRDLKRRPERTTHPVTEPLVRSGNCKVTLLTARCGPGGG
jgi:hypothetical protein